MATARFRKPKPFGSRSETSEVSEPKKSFYIVCEGEKTENQYFNGVFNHRSALKINQLIDIVVIEQEEGAPHVPHPKHLVDACVNMISDEKSTKSDLINYDKSIDEIWIIFDRDPQTLFEEQFEYVVETCIENGFHIGFTNPTFEFWLLLHLPDIQQYQTEMLLVNEKVGGKNSKRFVEKELSNRLENGYKKDNIRFERFIDKVELAIEQEKLFKRDILDIFTNVGSNIGILISKMKSSI